MQILKRNLVIYNTCLFLFLSLVYLHICFSLDADVSAIDFERLLGLISGMPILNLVGIAALYSILKIKKVSTYLLTLFSMLIFYKTFSIFLLTYDKLLLLLNFMFTLTSFNTILLLNEEMKKAIYKPRFKMGSLDVEKYRNVHADLEINNNSVAGVITNIDEYGFIFKPNNNINKMRGVVAFTISFADFKFQGRGEIVTIFEECFGVEALKKEETATKLGWEELYSIILKRNLFN